MNTQCSSCTAKWAFGTSGLCRGCSTEASASADAKEVAELKSLGIGTAIKTMTPRNTPAVPSSQLPTATASASLAAPSLEELRGGLDPTLVEAQNTKRSYKIAYLTTGDRAHPCVVVPPGGGSTKEETLFWARELAAIGPFFVVMYDLRGTGGSEPRDKWATLFAPTTPIREMERVLGVREAVRRAEPESTSSPGQAEPRPLDGHIGSLSTHTQKSRPAPLVAAISNRLHDFDGYAEDALSVLDALGIQSAHFVGLSQGGVLARLAAMRCPERVLSVVSCGSASSKLGLMLAAFSTGAERFHDQVKSARLFDADGQPPWGGRRAAREEYVPWRATLVEMIAPGFDKAIYTEMAAASWDAGYMDETDSAIAALAYEAWERQGKDKLHLEALRRNQTVPIMFVHGRKDPVIHFEESQTLFAQAGNCVLEAHEFGHNFGPPRHQTALLGRMASFMRSSAKGRGRGGDASSSRAAGVHVGTDTYASGVSPEVHASLSLDSTIPELWDAFCRVQTAADTGFALHLLLEKLELTHLQGRGLQLFLALQQAMAKAGLTFRQKKLLTDLQSSLTRAQKLVARLRGAENETAQAATEETAAKSSGGGFAFNEILICGAGPVGLRAACELALLGFQVTVVEKRPNFSRANILTFWDETMSDMLALGAKSYFPSLQPTGTNKFLGTRQIQVCLLKTLLLFGGVVHYGMEIYGLVPPGSDGKWRASFRPYVRHRRAAETNANAKQLALREGAETGPAHEDGKEAAALEFQQAKNYGGKEVANMETWEVDRAFLNGQAAAGTRGRASGSESGSESGSTTEGLAPVDFDAYIIAEGGWSDSTRRLGFTKSVEIFKPVFGLVVNLKYDPEDLKERNMRSQIHFVLGPHWPLSNCPIQAEFVEYLKGETHFFALVVSKKNHYKDTTDTHLERMKPEDRANLPDEVIAHMRRASQQKGLLEMGVLRNSYASGAACIASDNVDMERLHEMVREITQELGLPASTALCETNPVQLFDFSRRARCVDPVRVLSSSESAGAMVLPPGEFLNGGHSGVQALVLPIGDALQEPVWTAGLGINRGFHTAMNQAYACLLARETAKSGASPYANLDAAVRESCLVHEKVGKMGWGVGHAGLAGGGSGSVGLKPFKEWDTDPRNRLPIR